MSTASTAPAGKRRLLVLNPNTSQRVSALLARHVGAAAGPAVEVQTATARFGAAYIASEAACAVAGHAALDAWAAHVARHGLPDALLIGCFGDPGLFALRELCPCPVTGLAEGAFAQAAAASPDGRFAVVTGGAAWGPILVRLADALGFGGALAGLHTVAPSGALLAADPARALPLLAEACRAAARASGAGCVVLGGAGLAGMAAQVQPEVPVPVIDSVLAGTRHALALTAGGGPAPQSGDAADPSPWGGLSAELQALLSAAAR